MRRQFLQGKRDLGSDLDGANGMRYRAVIVMRPVGLVLGFVLALVGSARACPHDSAAAGPAPKKLGTVSFPSSCSPEVQAELSRGIALQHSFWFGEAQRSFERVLASDPQCAIASWGVAMSLVPWLNAYPDAATAAAARKALERADAATKKSPREADYVKALHALFDGYTPETALAHMSAHATAMTALSAKYPTDLEAQVFDALALVAAAPPDDTKLVHQHKAMTILAPLFKKYPNHPGIAHYITHACDNPQMARDGLAAARRYAAIAPASPHALHMPGHIFIRLGLWQDDIKTNLASKAAAEAGKVAAESRLHAMEFLEYAYLQAGQYDKARAIVTEAGTIKESDVDPRFAGYAGFVKARFAMLLAVETQDWTMATKLNNVGYATFGQAQIALAHAICAAHTKDVNRAMNARKLVDGLYAGAPENQLDLASKTLRDEVRAWALFTGGNLPGAEQILRPIADLQAKYGKEEIELPAREMLAEMYLLGGKHKEALVEFQASLKSDPNRLNALIGAGKAAEGTGDKTLADKLYKTARTNLANADASGLARLKR
jgi:tetratricopeptide (TPR) repeat protein